MEDRPPNKYLVNAIVWFHTEVRTLMQKEINSRLLEDNLIIDWPIELDFRTLFLFTCCCFDLTTKKKKSLN